MHYSSKVSLGLAGLLIPVLPGLGAGHPAAAHRASRAGDNQIIVRLHSADALAQFDAKYGTTVLAALPDGVTYLLRLPEGDNVDQDAAEMSTDPSVYQARPNQLIGIPEPALPATAPSPAAEPSSMPFFDGQRGPGAYTSQYALTLIHAQQAWAITTGVGEVVAVLDTGVDAAHPQLQGRLTAGFNALDGSGNTLETKAGIDSNGDGYPDGAYGHGTDVAGIVALTAPGATIMPVKVLDSDGVGTAFGVALGIYYAAAHGARVINLSLGMAGRDGTIGDALAYAIKQGAVVVASAGNDGLSNVIQSPASEDGVVAVAATDSADRKAPFSNYGSPVTVCAPGVGIEGLFPGGGYAVWSGTSMAAPFVSAEAVLIRAAHPGWKVKKVIKDLQTSADDIGIVNPLYAGELGGGRINLQQALQ